MILFVSGSHTCIDNDNVHIFLFFIFFSVSFLLFYHFSTASTPKKTFYYRCNHFQKLQSQELAERHLPTSPYCLVLFTVSYQGIHSLSISLLSVQSISLPFSLSITIKCCLLTYSYSLPSIESGKNSTSTTTSTNHTQPRHNHPHTIHSPTTSP